MVLAVCYHGTTFAVAKQIEAGRLAFQPSVHDWNWLGTGIYFFQDAPKRAALWARFRYPRQETAVLEAEIDLEGCLDLFEARAWAQLRMAYTEFLASEDQLESGATQEGLRIEQGIACTNAFPADEARRWEISRNFRDRAFLDWYVRRMQIRKPVRSIRSPFLWGEALYADSFLFDWAHAQVSVVDASGIIGAARLVAP